MYHRWMQYLLPLLLSLCGTMADEPTHTYVLLHRLLQPKNCQARLASKVGNTQNAHRAHTHRNRHRHAATYRSTHTQTPCDTGDIYYTHTWCLTSCCPLTGWGFKADVLSSSTAIQPASWQPRLFFASSMVDPGGHLSCQWSAGHVARRPSWWARKLVAASLTAVSSAPTLGVSSEAAGEANPNLEQETSYLRLTR